MNENIFINDRTELKDGTIFNNNGYVLIDCCYITINLIFENDGRVLFTHLKELSNNIIFNNTKEISLPKEILLIDLSYKQIINIYNRLTHNKFYLVKNDLLPIIREYKLKSII